MIDPKEHLCVDIPEVKNHAKNIASSLEYVAAELDQIGLSFSAHLVRTGALAVTEATNLAERMNGQNVIDSQGHVTSGRADI